MTNMILPFHLPSHTFVVTDCGQLWEVNHHHGPDVLVSLTRAIYVLDDRSEKCRGKPVQCNSFLYRFKSKSPGIDFSAFMMGNKTYFNLFITVKTVLFFLSYFSSLYTWKSSYCFLAAILLFW